MLGATMVVATVPVTDLDRAKEFYGGTLGLEMLWENPASVRYRCGDVSEISVFQRPPVEREHTLAHFEVADIEADPFGFAGSARGIDDREQVVVGSLAGR